MAVEDIDRPDVGGVPAKMSGIAELAKKELTGLVPYLVIRASDNLCSTVGITGSFDAKESWSYGILENSRYFRLTLQPKGRYYTEGEKISVELLSGCKKFRKYTGTPEKVIEKISEYLGGYNAS